MIENDTKADFKSFDLVSFLILKILFIIKFFGLQLPQVFLQEAENPDSIVIGYSPSSLTYDNINRAYHLLTDNPTVPLIAMHKGKYLQTSSGTNLGPGHFVSLLESAAEKTAEVLGKPNNSFFLSALGNISPDETVMIGDDFAGISILSF